MTIALIVGGCVTSVGLVCHTIIRICLGPSNTETDKQIELAREQRGLLQEIRGARADGVYVDSIYR